MVAKWVIVNQNNNSLFYNKEWKSFYANQWTTYFDTEIEAEKHLETAIKNCSYCYILKVWMKNE